jgi:cytochrome b
MADSRSNYRVWDPVVRIGHWLLALSIALAWFTKEGGGVWHEWIGYVSLGLVALRVAWGCVGSRYARFSRFVCSPAATWRYVGQLWSGRKLRYVGHNPLGGWMILALLVNTALAGLSGWLYTTNAYWGEQWLEDVHEAFAISLLVLVAFHVAGVIVSSAIQRENLVVAMVDGHKRPPAGDDIDR